MSFPSFLNVSVCGVVTHIFSLFCPMFYHFLNVLSQRRYQHWWWAFLWSVFELSRPGSVWHWSNFWCFFSEATPAAPSLPKPCHANPNQSSFVFSWCLNFLFPNYSSIIVLHSNSGLVDSFTPLPPLPSTISSCFIWSHFRYVCSPTHFPHLHNVITSSSNFSNQAALS